MSLHDTAEFEAKVKEQGYVTVRKSLGPGEGLGEHAHEFDVWGLVTQGEFSITVEGQTASYKEGEEFQLDAGCLHSEQAGPQGASFVSGRRTR